ncbi:MAG: ABC transporter permease subunit [Acholeplasmatales bacterium]|nr:ABC transporter permease subunit [Acholeplasmatales bacterium]
MKNLFRSELFRARKDKVLLIGFIVSIGLVILSLFLTKILETMANNADESGAIGAMMTTSGIAAWSNGVSVMGNTAQMIAPIFITIFFVKEFNDRTIRNKLIIGYTRSQIFFTIILVHFIISLVYLFGASFVGLVFGTVLFGLGADFTLDLVGLLIFGFIIQFLLSYVLMGFCIIFSINKQSIALGIVLPIAIGFILSLIGSFAILGVSEGFTKVMSFTNCYQSLEFQNMTSLEDFILKSWVEVNEKRYAVPLNPLGRFLIVTPIVIVLELVIGYFRFKKIQFK